MANQTKPNKRITLNLKKVFDRESMILIRSYKTLLTRKRGVRQDDAPANALSTILNKGKDHWLVDTSETKTNVFKRRTSSLSMEVYSSESKHSGTRTYYGVKGGHKGKKRGVRRPREEKRIVKSKSRPKYSEIMQWHNQKNYSGIFGGKWPVGSKAPERIGAEILRQAKKQAIQQIDRTIKLRFG